MQQFGEHDKYRRALRDRHFFKRQKWTSALTNSFPWRRKDIHHVWVRPCSAALPKAQPGGLTCIRVC